MNCVKCNSATSVVDSRPLKFCKKTHRDASAIKRRRKCNSCGHMQEMEVPFNTDFFWPER